MFLRYLVIVDWILSRCRHREIVEEQWVQCSTSVGVYQFTCNVHACDNVSSVAIIYNLQVKVTHLTIVYDYNTLTGIIMSNITE